jgi:hypothetical protein
MRRHYRNHARSGLSRANAPNSKSIRRRMERISATTLALIGANSRAASSSAAVGRSGMAVQSVTHDNTSDESEEDMPDGAGPGSEFSGSDWNHERDGSIEDAEVYRRNRTQEQRGRYSRSNRIRRTECGSDSRHPRENASPSGHRDTPPKICGASYSQRAAGAEGLKQTSPYTNSYTPSSSVYLDSCADSNVSTVLRPAFNSKVGKEEVVW